MSELPVPLQHLEKKKFCVVLRCESRVFAEPAKSYALPEVDTEDGPMMFVIGSEFAPTSSGRLSANFLIIYTELRALTLKDANLAAQKAATIIISYLAFVHNAFIEAPLRWFTYQSESSSDWRRVTQIDYETSGPKLTRYTVQFKHDLSCRFVHAFGRNLNRNDAHKFVRSLDLYCHALANWDHFHALHAAQLLFMAAEPLTGIALRGHLEEVHKTKEELFEPFLNRELETAAAIPNAATKEDKETILAIYKRVGVPGAIYNSAWNKFSAEIRRKTIFVDSPTTHDILNKATNGFEHGYDHISKTLKLVLPHLDKAAACVRTWISKQCISDVGLVSDLLADDIKMPISLNRFELLVDAEFLSESEHHPTRNCWSAPFEVVPVMELSGSVGLNVKSSVLHSVAVRVLGSTVRFPLITYADETRYMNEVMEKFYGFKMGDG